ncbi:hypothetical protein R3P38DRAFT_3186998 [Favolaschia claudopus]|uniref:Uncharacterized protein n=1 Tax=Favolaschia claudopus TaxID=2862362 RepID=A0AAW0C3I2_9AGAR
MRRGTFSSILPPQRVERVVPPTTPSPSLSPSPANDHTKASRRSRRVAMGKAQSSARSDGSPPPFPPSPHPPLTGAHPESLPPTRRFRRPTALLNASNASLRLPRQIHPQSHLSPPLFTTTHIFRLVHGDRDFFTLSTPFSPSHPPVNPHPLLGPYPPTSRPAAAVREVEAAADAYVHTEKYIQGAFSTSSSLPRPTNDILVVPSATPSLRDSYPTPSLDLNRPPAATSPTSAFRRVPPSRRLQAKTNPALPPLSPSQTTPPATSLPPPSSTSSTPSTPTAPFRRCTRRLARIALELQNQTNAARCRRPPRHQRRRRRLDALRVDSLEIALET